MILSFFSLLLLFFSFCFGAAKRRNFSVLGRGIALTQEGLCWQTEVLRGFYSILGGSAGPRPWELAIGRRPLEVCWVAALFPAWLLGDGLCPRRISVALRATATGTGRENGAGGRGTVFASMVHPSWLWRRCLQRCRRQWSLRA